MNLLTSKTILNFWLFMAIGFALSSSKSRHFELNIYIIKFLSQNMFDFSVVGIKVCTSSAVSLIDNFK